MSITTRISSYLFPKYTNADNMNNGYNKDYYEYLKKYDDCKKINFDSQDCKQLPRNNRNNSNINENNEGGKPKTKNQKPKTKTRKTHKKKTQKRKR